MFSLIISFKEIANIFLNNDISYCKKMCKEHEFSCFDFHFIKLITRSFQLLLVNKMKKKINKPMSNIISIFMPLLVSYLKANQKIYSTMLNKI